jgi:hypothetical protein
VVALTFAHYCYRFIGAVKLQNKIDLQTQTTHFFFTFPQKNSGVSSLPMANDNTPLVAQTAKPMISSAQ